MTLTVTAARLDALDLSTAFRRGSYLLGVGPGDAGQGTKIAVCPIDKPMRAQPDAALQAFANVHGSDLMYVFDRFDAAIYAEVCTRITQAHEKLDRGERPVSEDSVVALPNVLLLIQLVRD